MTNQSRPLFSVGEEVILNDPTDLLHETTQIIAEVFWSEDMLWAVPFEEKKCWVYSLQSEGEGWWWPERNIKKKYPPSSQSFSELIDSLKSPAKIS